MTFISDEIQSEGGITGNTINSTLDVTAGGNLRSINSIGDEGGELFLNKPITNTTITDGVTIDVYQNKLRFFEKGGTLRGGFYDITTLGAGVSTDFGASQSSTSGVGVTPTATQTDTVTHSLGRTPVKIRIYGMGGFTNNASATPTPFSIGTYTSSGNRCIYQPIGASLTTAAVPVTSTTFAIRIDTAAGAFIQGVIQNITSTTFQIAWTETGTVAARVYMWEAE